MKLITFYAHVVLLLFGCYFLSFYNIYMINVTKQAIQEFTNASFDKQFDYYLDEDEFIELYSTMSALQQVAQVPMFIFGVFIIDRLGRTKSLIIGSSISILGSVVFEIAIFSMYFEFIYVGQLVYGVGNALIIQSQRLYFAEITSTKQRSVVSGIKELIRSIVTGCLLILGNARYLGSVKLWPALIGLAIPFGIASIIRLWFVPDTPMHLMLHNPEEAQKSFEFYNSDFNSLVFKNKPIQQTNKMSYLKVLRENKGAFGIVLTTLLMNVFSMGNICAIYGILILEGCSLSPAYASDVASIVGYAKIAAAVVAIPLMIKVPRKILLVGLMLFQQVNGALVVVFATLVYKYKMDWAVTGCVVAISCAWITSSIVSAQVSNIGVESCNQQSRALISSISNTFARLVIVVIQLVLPTIINMAGVTVAVAPIQIVNLILLIITMCYLRETGNREIGTAYEMTPLI